MELEGPPENKSEFEKQIKSMVEKQTKKTLTLKKLVSLFLDTSYHSTTLILKNYAKMILLLIII